MKKILVGTDTTASADLAVQRAAELARFSEAELVVVNVRPNGAQHDVADPKKAADPDRYLADLPRRFPEVHVRILSESGDPAERLVEVADSERANTIVLGNRGMHGSWWRVRDSVPNIVLRHAPCSVFIVDTRTAQ
ncbi:MAG: universal stress protein [Actinomycetota bacterium]